MKTTNPQHRLLALLSIPVFLFLVIPTAIVVPVALNDSRYITFPPGGNLLRRRGRILRRPGLDLRPDGQPAVGRRSPS